MLRIIPSLLLKNDSLVKTVRFGQDTYVGDPINVVKIFNEKEVDELIVLDISAAKNKTVPNMVMIENLASECFMPLCYGGGVRSLEHMESIFHVGVEKIALNTQAVRDPGLITRAAQRFGSQSIIVSIDVKKSLLGKEEVMIEGGNVKTSKHPLDWAREVESLGAGEILLNSIDCDGMRQGYNIDLIHKISSAVGIPVIACGGAGQLNDFADAAKAGASAVAAGSFFVFHGKHKAVLITYPDKEALQQLEHMTQTA